MPAGDITQGYIFVPAEKSIDQVKMNAIVGQAYINPAFISAQTESTSSTTGDYFLLLKSGGTLAKIVLDNLANSLAATTGFQSQIWSVRLRSFNSVGNPNFEVAQRNCGVVVSNPGAGAFIEDRWGFNKSGTLTGTISAQRIGPASSAANAIILPGTNYSISGGFMRVTVATQQASLAAGDFCFLDQAIEGPNLRELWNDVHSFSILVRSSVANLKFGVTIQDNAGTRSLPLLCTIPTANVFTLLTFSNLPVFPSAGTYSIAPGSVGYYMFLTLAAGTTYTAAANGTWQSANVLAANGQSNFLGQTVGSTLDFAFIQHEPGPQCTTLTDVPFVQNYDQCLRYFCKSYPLATKQGTASVQAGLITGNVPANFLSGVYANINFPKPMAKIPSVNSYAYDGTLNGITIIGGGTIGISGFNQVGETGFGGATLSAAGTSNNSYQFHYAADTNW
jgi:hypothetical protein